MERFTISLDESLARQFDELISARGYSNRSEAVRDLIRGAIQHDHHDLTVAAMHVHLDHENCLETVILRGKTDAVVRFSERLMAESGVRHGQFNLIAVEPAHRHAHGESDSKHIHYRPSR